MDAGDALADAVVDGDERPIGGFALFNGPFQQLHILEQWPDEGRGEVGQRLVMLLWHEQAVAGEKRPLVQKSQGEAVFKDQRGLFLTAEDATERAGCAFVWSVSWNI